MHDDATFLAMLAAEPHDRAVLLVYADWLEGSGDSARADVLRRIHALLHVPHDQIPPFAEARTLLVAASDAVPAGWLAHFMFPPLVNTCWSGTSGHMTVIRFLPDNVLNYSQADATYQNGTWRQVGNVVAMETNRHFADYEGVILGDRIAGEARNITETAWPWSAERTVDPEVVKIPDGVVTTVFDDHARRRRRGRRDR